MKNLSIGLKKTKERLLGPLGKIFSSRALDEEAVEQLEEILISADLGVEATERIIGDIKEKLPSGGSGAGEYLSLVAGGLASIIEEVPPYRAPGGNPRVIVVIGVNGVGKTSTIGKLASRFTAEGRSVLLAACDTFRAAAIEQLDLWAEKAGVPVVKQKMGSDPAAVAFDAVQSAKSKGIDTVIVDTAGRLHTKSNLMEELRKIFRIVSTRIEGTSVEGWLVLDANSGQNSIRQAEAFVKALPVTGLILTKLDSTAKGGAVIPIQAELRVPLLYVGVGETVDDLEPFDHRAFVKALVGLDGD